MLAFDLVDACWGTAGGRDSVEVLDWVWFEQQQACRVGGLAGLGWRTHVGLVVVAAWRHNGLVTQVLLL